MAETLYASASKHSHTKRGYDPMTHAELCERAERWLKSNGCSVTASEIATGTSQQPDAIGFRNFGLETWLIECKVSRSDFRADRKKHHQSTPEKSIGSHRWYMTPAGLLSAHDLPEGWGLLEVANDRVRIIKGSPKSVKTSWDQEANKIIVHEPKSGRAHVFKERNHSAEMAILYSIARRMVEQSANQ